MALLTDAGLVPGRRIDRFNDNIEADLIVRTDPAADAQVPPARSSTTWSPRGPEPAPVPDVTGLPIDDAERVAG